MSTCPQTDAAEVAVDVLTTFRRELELLQQPEFVEPPPADLQCSLCLNVLIDASETACGHLFCSTCINAWLSAKSAATESEHRSCPLCRAAVEHVQPSFHVRARVAALRVNCRLCRSQLRYPEFGAHVASPIEHFEQLCQRTKDMQSELTNAQRTITEQVHRMDFEKSLLQTKNRDVIASLVSSRRRWRWAVVLTLSTLALELYRPSTLHSFWCQILQPRMSQLLEWIKQELPSRFHEALESAWTWFIYVVKLIRAWYNKYLAARVLSFGNAVKLLWSEAGTIASQ